MSLWMVIVLLGLVKLPVAALMLWIPFREDQAMGVSTTTTDTEGADSEDDGGSMVLEASPVDPHPRSPRPCPRRRGPHGSDTPSSPRRIRRPAATAGLRTTMTRAHGRGVVARRVRAQRLRLR
jgi:hypothetical protein